MSKDKEQILGTIGVDNVGNAKKKKAKATAKPTTAASLKKLEAKIGEINDKMDSLEEMPSDMELFSVAGKFLHVKVGSEKKPATEDEISGIQSSLSEMFENSGIPCFAFVTHHEVVVDVH